MTTDEVVLKDGLVCVNCGADVQNGVIIERDAYCIGCSLSPAAISKAQAAFLKGAKR